MSYLKIAKTAGFCKGVKRAVEKALAISKKTDRETVTLGPIIHNPQVLDQLNNLGIKSINDPKDGVNKNVVIRAHGIPPKTREELKSINACVCDATCPDVGKVQGIIRKYAVKGYSTIIVGDEGHAEVKGLLGFTNGRGYVISMADEVTGLPYMEKVCVVAQTTQQKDVFEAACDKIKTKFGAGNCIIFDTICQSTIDRQDEVYQIAKSVDLMIIIGGKNSANTARLAKISSETGAETLFVESETDIEKIDVNKYTKIGVTAGASTPNWMIKRVVVYIKKKKQEKYPVFIKRIISFWHFIIHTNLLVAFAGGCLSYSACYLQHILSRKEYFWVSFFYILAMYTIKSSQNKSSLKLNEPVKLKFYEDHKILLSAMIIASITAVLLITFSLGAIPFSMSIIFILIGAFYHKLGIPFINNGKLKLKMISQIPGSKDLIVVLGWAAMLIFVPLLSSGNPIFSIANITSLLFVVTLVSIRSIANDIREIQEDMMVGAETLPIFMGRKKALNIITAMVVTISLMLVFGSVFGWVPAVGCFLIIPVLSMYFFSRNNDVFQYTLNIYFSDLMDFHIIFAGIISYLQNLHKFTI